MAESGNGPTQPGQGPAKKQFSMETRLLLAFILMGVILFLTPYFYKPQSPPKSPIKPVQPPAAEQVQPPEPPPATPKPAEAAPTEEVAAEKAEDFHIQTKLFEVTFSNRGAVVKQWQLKNYVDANGKRLELVNQAAVEKTGYPFALEFKNQKPPVDFNAALWVAKPTPDGLGIDLEYSSAGFTGRKSFRFRNDSYLAQVSSEVTENATTPVPHLLAWRGGFGDATLQNAASAQHSVHYDVSQSKLIVNDAKAAKNGPVSSAGSFSFAGVEDNYFAAVFLPAMGASTEITTFSDPIPTAGKEVPYVGAAIGGGGENRFELFVGPKDIDILKKVDPKLENLVDFGWFSFLAKPLFYALNWTADHLTRNYGWAIVLVTVVINLLLWPLRLSQMKSMRKMSSLQPQIAAINERYKGLSMRDPRQAEKNQEVMELYKKHGVNPMGGCLPLVMQMPFFFAFYKVLTVAIEMRGAKWLWVSDLSIPETLPIRVLPIVMVAAQFLQQKMTPSTSADPSQQRIMMLMPLMLGFMFYGVSSGLVLYWLTGNLVGIAQQLLMNKMLPPPPAPAVAAKPPAKKRPRN